MLRSGKRVAEGGRAMARMEKKVRRTYKNIYYTTRLVSKVHVFSYTLNAKSIPPFKQRTLGVREMRGGEEEMKWSIYANIK